jgi:isopentenyl diphosphate isomerase/L-lactate dehydrogenase-like FMN-dependent dehydrogenase
MTSEEVTSLMRPDLDWGDVERFMALAGLPVVLKGVLSADDARIAAEVGAAGVVVSNHGGRQLDTTPATIDVLAGVVDPVEERIEVLLDGGVRRGTDVVKALALGARAVLVGRPVVWALAAAGEAGVRRALEMIADETRTALALAGCARPADATAALVRPARR